MYCDDFPVCVKAYNLERNCHCLPGLWFCVLNACFTSSGLLLFILIMSCNTWVRIFPSTVVSTDIVSCYCVSLNLFNQDNISSPFATANIEACIFAIGLISWTNCLSAILLLWELWGLTNSVLTPQCYPLLLFLKIWFLQVRPCLSLCLYWDVLLSVFYYTLY